MTIVEAHRSFNVQTDKVGSGRNRTFPPDAVDLFLEKATDVFVDAALDSAGIGPEQTMRQRDLIDSLTRTHVFSGNDLARYRYGMAGDLTTVSPAVRNLLPDGYAKAVDCDVVLRGEYVTSEEVQFARDHSFRRTDPKYGRVLLTRIENKVVAVDGASGVIIEEIGIRYIRSLPAVYIGTYQKPNQTLGTPVELAVNDDWHQYVVTMAVIMASLSIGDEASAAAAQSALQMGFPERLIAKAQKRAS